MQIRKVDSACVSELAALAARIWDGDAARLERDFEHVAEDPAKAMFLASDEGVAIGFCLCALRNDYVHGATSSPVAYLEGVYVDAPYRGCGVARQLVEHAKDWALAQGCRQIASDCPSDNASSMRLHAALGFREAARIVCYVAPLE